MPKDIKKNKSGVLTLEGVIAKKIDDLSEYRNTEDKTTYVAANKILRIGRVAKMSLIRPPRVRIQKMFVPVDEYETTLNTVMNNLMTTGSVLLYTKSVEHMKALLHTDTVGSHYVWKKGTEFSLQGICFRSQSMVIDDCDVDVEDIENFNSLHPSNFQQIVILKKK